MDDNTLLAGVYARISEADSDDVAGVTRQTDDGHALVARRGGKVVIERSDNDISALRGKHRPGYGAIMAAAQSGTITHIVVWQTSRLWRNRRERAEGIEFLQKHGVSVLAVKGPDLDLSTAYGRGMAGLLGEFDTMESEVKSERILRKVQELAEAGAIANGGCRPFGYRRIYSGEGDRRKILRDEIEPGEAEIVKECKRRILAGESMRSVVGDLNTRGIATSTGGKWSMQGMRTMLRSGRIAGLRERKGVVVGKAVWPAIISVEEHKQLRALLDSRGTNPTGRVRKFYLTGFVFCDRCNLAMKTVPMGGKTKYRCAPKQEGGCNGRVIMLAELEKLVDEYLIVRMSDKETLRQLTARAGANDDRAAAVLERIEGHERRLMLLQAQLEDGDEEEIPEVMASIRGIRRRLEEARGELAQVTAQPDIAQLDLSALAAGWKDLHLDQKRVLLALFVEKITIAPARRGLGRFDPDRVDIVPKL
jgi:DNA invertase Pin-like site-specific DNA recombinase